MDKKKKIILFSSIGGAIALIAAIIIIIVCVTSGNNNNQNVEDGAYRMATVSKFNGDVKVNDSTKDETAYVGQKLKNNYSLTTDNSSKCYVSVDSDKTVKVEESSKMVVTELSDKKLKLKLVYGDFHFNVVNKLADDESMEFDCGATTMMVRGTQGHGSYDPETDTFEFMVYSGKVELTNGDETVLVTAGVKVTVTNGNQVEVSSYDINQIDDECKEDIKENERDVDRVCEAFSEVNNKTTAENLELFNHEHSYGAGVESTHAACQDYTITYTCSCGATKVENKTATSSHTYNEPEYTWSDDLKKCSAKRVCSLCTFEESEDGVITTSLVQNLSCDDAEIIKYTATFKNEAFETQVKLVETRKALGHTYSTPEYTWSDDLTTCTALVYCTNDREHTIRETVTSVSEITFAGDCENPAKSKFTATFENGLFEVQVITDVVTGTTGTHNFENGVASEHKPCQDYTITYTCKCGATRVEDAYAEESHTFGDAIVVKESTLTTNGEVKYVCSVCGYEEHYTQPMLEGYYINVLGGEVLLDGKSYGDYAKFEYNAEVTIKLTDTTHKFLYFMIDDHFYGDKEFKMIVKEDTLVAAIFSDVSYDFGAKVVVTEVTCEDNGLTKQVCKNTGYTIYKTVYAKGHNYGKAVTIKEETCTSKGAQEQTCIYCGNKEIYQIGVKGHDYNDWTIKTAANGSLPGVKVHTCKDCGHKEEKNYIDVVYPAKNLDIVFDYYDYYYGARSTSARDEELLTYGNTTLYYIYRDCTGAADSPVYTYFAFVDNGAHSPIYVCRTTGSYNYVYQQTGASPWALYKYVDSYDEFIKFLDDETKGADNGRNNTSIYYLYNMWAKIYNNAGGNLEYTETETTYLGKKCRAIVYGNESFTVDENNCTLFYTYSSSHSYYMKIVSMDEATELKYSLKDAKVTFTEPTTLKFCHVNFINCGDNSMITSEYRMYYYVVNYYYKPTFFTNNYSDSEIEGYEVQKLDGTWVLYTGSLTYMEIITNLLGETEMRPLSIRPRVKEKALNTTITVEGGHIDDYSGNYPSTIKAYVGQSVYIVRDDIADDMYVEGFEITINGETTVIDSDYSYTIKVADEGVITVKIITKKKVALNSTVTSTAGGYVFFGSYYSESDYYETDNVFYKKDGKQLQAVPYPGYEFEKWEIKEYDENGNLLEGEYYDLEYSRMYFNPLEDTAKVEITCKFKKIDATSLVKVTLIGIHCGNVYATTMYVVKGEGVYFEVNDNEKEFIVYAQYADSSNNEYLTNSWINISDACTLELVDSIPS